MCSANFQKLEETVAPVRDAASETLGTMLKLVGEKPVMVYLNDLDNLKQAKVCWDMY